MTFYLLFTQQHGRHFFFFFFFLNPLETIGSTPGGKSLMLTIVQLVEITTAECSYR